MTTSDACACPNPSTCGYCSRMYPCDCAGCEARVRAPAAAPYEDSRTEAAPDCRTCAQGLRDERGVPLEFRIMFLCPDCGNKRCPRATDHTLACTGSNAPGQPGSAYR